MKTPFTSASTSANDAGFYAEIAAFCVSVLDGLSQHGVEADETTLDLLEVYAVGAVRATCREHNTPIEERATLCTTLLSSFFGNSALEAPLKTGTFMWAATDASSTFHTIIHRGESAFLEWQVAPHLFDAHDFRAVLANAGPFEIAA